jgi:hypothetical protein
MSINQFKTCLEGLSPAQATELAADLKTKNLIFQGTMGPNTVLYYPAGWFTCERTMSGSAYGVRKTMFGKRDLAKLRAVDQYRVMPSKLMQNCFNMLESIDNVAAAAVAEAAANAAAPPAEPPVAP